MTRTVVLELDDLDYAALQKALDRRQQWPRPDGGGNVVGQCVAEICRGWLEFTDRSARKGGG